MTRFLTALFVATATFLPAAAQPDIMYDIGWEDAEDHYFDVTMEIGGLSEPTVEVRMPAWRPGRYIIQNYVRYVIAFAASTPDGERLPFEKVDKDTWRVATLGNERIVVNYRNYANVLDGGESFLGESEAYLNPVSVLMNVPGRMTEPVGLTLQRPEGWRIATALDYDEAVGAFLATDYHELVDTPFLVSPDFDLISFEESGATIEIAVQGDWEYDEDRLVADHRAIVSAQANIMQTVPFKRYLFMYHVLDHPIGHGVEHKNSTSIVLGPASAMTMPASGEYATGMYRAFLGVASHELFHAWNVERIRPEVMYPTDYSSEQYTTQMWIFEGITDYYADVALHRAGLTTEEAFLNGLAGTIRSFDQSPGRKITSIAMSSFDSWTKQDDAPPNTFYSFYTAGKAMGLVLDMEVRGRTGGEKSLDDVFRFMYSEYPMKDRGLPEDGFQEALEAVTGSSFEEFFDRHIYGTEDVDWNVYLSWAGLSLVEGVDTNPASWLRVFLGGMTIVGIDPDGFAASSGLEAGDEFKIVGGQNVTDDETLAAAFAQFAPGDVADVVVIRDGEEHVVELEVGTPPVEFVMVVSADASAEQSAIRRSWLGQ